MKAGSPATIEMPFTAHPQPQVSLAFKDGDVRDANRIKTVTVKNKTSFMMKDSERPDTGIYTIILENEFGKATVDITVTVLGKF